MTNPESIDDLVGIPFVEGGRSHAGIDCLGLVLSALDRLGLPWPDPWERICEQWRKGDRPIAECVPSDWAEIPPETPVERGDVLVTGDKAQHIALALGCDYVLHTTEQTGSLVSRARVFRGRIRWLFRKRRTPA